MRKNLIAALFVLIHIFPAIVLGSSQTASCEPLDVNVKNFPETQYIKGSIAIQGPITHSKYITKENLVIPTSGRNELSELLYAGSLDTDGFTSIVISMQGEIRSESFSSGTVGILLIPDEKPVFRALREARRIQFPIEAVAQLKSGSSTFFESEQVQQRIAFPRYKIFLYIHPQNQRMQTCFFIYQISDKSL
jgi:hypothetical protein